MKTTDVLQEMSVKCRQNMVDGRHPAPIDMVNIPLFTGFYTFSGGFHTDF